MRTRSRPGLLDLLTDDCPSEARDGEEASSFSLKQLRGAILRELSWLFNANGLELTVDLGAYPEVARSSLNYGMRSLTGRDDSAKLKNILRNEILTCLRRFEPRLLPGNLQVTMVPEGTRESYYFRIEGDLWAEPQPLHMLMRTQVGSTGDVHIVDLRGDAG